MRSEWEEHKVVERRRVRVRCRAWAVLCALLLAGGTTMGCEDESLPGSTPLRPLAEVIAAHADSLMAVPDVVGVYEGADSRGRPVLKVMLARRSAEAERRLPRQLEGYRVEREVTGPVRPM